MPVQLMCEGCKAVFSVSPITAKRGRRYCSRECRSAAGRVAIVCEHCKTSFIRTKSAIEKKRARGKRVRFCSWSCAKEAMYTTIKAVEDKTCEVCGHRFSKPERESMYSWERRRFCSLECKSEGHAEYFARRRQAYRDAGEKRCTRCGEIKPLGAFRKAYGHQDALQAACVECLKQELHRRYWSDPEIARLYARVWARRHPEQQRKRWANYYAKNREQQLEKWRRYRERNRERINAGFRAARADTPPEIRRAYNRILSDNPDRRRYVQRYCEKHREVRAANARRWRKENPDRSTEKSVRYRARKLNAPLVERIDRSAVITRFGSVCYLCDRVLEPSEVTLDHVVPLSRGGEHSQRNLRPCCQSCNSKKGARMWIDLEDAYPAMAERIRSHIT